MFERLIWLVPLTVAILGAWRPRAGLIAFVAALPVFGSPPGGPYLGALDVAAIAAIVTSWRGGRPAASPLAWPAIAFTGISLLSLVPSPYTPPSWDPFVVLDLLWALPGVESSTALYTWRAAADLALGYGLFLSVRRTFSRSSIQPLLWSFAGGLGVLFLIGILSHLGIVDLSGFRPQRALLAGGERLTSLFFLSGWLSQYVVLATPVALVAFSQLPARWRTFAEAAFFVLAFSTIMLTHQRGAWVAVGAQVACWIVALLPALRGSPPTRRNAVKLAAITLAATGILTVAVSGSMTPFVERVQSIQTGFSPRLPLWAAAIELLEQRPISGWGLGTFAPAYDLLHPRGSTGARENRSTAHNLYLNLAAERGLLGVAALGLLGWVLASNLWRVRDAPSNLPLALGISVVGATVYGLVQYLFHVRSIGWCLWILLALAAVQTSHAAPRTGNRISHALVLLALVWLPIRLAVFDRPAYSGSSSFGFHEVENGSGGAFRWAESKAATRLPWVGKVLVLSLANGHPMNAVRPVEVTLRVDSETLPVKLDGGEWTTFRIEVGKPRSDWLVLRLECDRPFRPYSNFRQYPNLAPSDDIRELCVVVKDIHFERSADELLERKFVRPESLRDGESRSHAAVNWSVPS